MSDAHLLTSYEVINDVRYGMTHDEVAAAAGPADGVRHDRILGFTHERRGATEYTFDDGTGTLRHIIVIKPGRGRAIRERLDGARYTPVFRDGIEILDPEGFATLFERERTVEGRGDVGVLFPELGFVVCGFRKRVPEGRYVIAFREDLLESYREDWLNV